MAIIELRVLEHKAGGIINKLFPGWEWFSNVSLRNKGRIWVVWNPTTTRVQIVENHEQLVHSVISSQVHRVLINFSVVYDKHTIADRGNMWRELGDIAAAQNRPWVIMGDFNAILCASDRMNGTTVQEAEVKDFRQFLADNDMVEMKSFGRDFTWTNGHLMSIIDHIIVNAEWMTNMTNMYHSPLLIDFGGGTRDGPKPFKFLNCLAKHPTFMELVKAQWKIHVNATQLEGFWLRLKHVKKGLKQLNVKEFTGVTARLALLRNNLQSIQSQVRTHHQAQELFHEEQAIHKQLEE